MVGCDVLEGLSNTDDYMICEREQDSLAHKQGLPSCSF